LPSFSNSARFSSTIAQYLRMAGWGTTTVISSGKDVYIHYAAPEFAFALANDRAAARQPVLLRTGRLLRARRPSSRKPVVACVVGRWKSKLTRAVGHARRDGGRLRTRRARPRNAGSWTSSAVDAIFTPGKSVSPTKGALVTNIAHIPVALTAGDARERAMPDFAPEGKPGAQAWFGSTKHSLPR
jgi:succinyl-CoA synthetase alpha subunit